MQYETVLRKHNFKSLNANYTLTVETLKDLDQAIDQLCSEIKDERDPLAEDLCPYFGVLWPSGIALAEYLVRMGGWLKDKSVLEIGCGLALPSIVAYKCGANVVATDFHEEVPIFLKKNQELNSTNIKYERIHWRNETNNLGKFDFVIGSDILYENTHPEFVAKTLNSHCKDKGHIILADPGRPYLQKAVDAIVQLGYAQDMFISQAQDPKGEIKDIFIFSFTKK